MARGGGVFGVTSTPGLPGARAIADPSLRAAWIAEEQARADASYSITPLRSGFDARNPGQGFAAVFADGGVQIRFDAATRALGGPWRPAPATTEALWIAFEFERWGAGELLEPAPAPGARRAVGNRLEIDRGPVVEWYVNGPLGLEQGFSVARPPTTTGSDLVLEIALVGDAKPELLAGGTQVALVAPSGAAWAHYGELFVRDAVGATLPARLEVVDDAIRIRVDVREAVYPLEVDPTIWIQEAELLHEKKRVDGRAGSAVAIDGTTALVGADSDSSVFSTRGTVHVYTRAGTVWTKQAELAPSDGVSGDLFGSSVALDGDYAIVGASDHDAAAGDDGAAYVFVRSGTVWAQQAKLVASVPQFGDRFGGSVAISGTTALVGQIFSDGAHVFTRSGTVWTQEQRLSINGNSSFGRAVALDGSTAVIGSPADATIANQAGAAHVFVRSGTTWTLQKTLLAADGAADDNFGTSVALDADTALVGARNDDDRGSESGSAYVFLRSGTIWTQQQKLLAADGTANDQFGYSVGLLGDTAAVGARGDTGGGSGSGYVFVRSGTTWAQQQKLVATSGDLGTSVAVGVDTAVLGGPKGPGVNQQTGDARVFSRSGTTWTEQAILAPDDGAAVDLLGSSLSLAGSVVVTGAPSDDPKGLGSGAVYSYARSGGVWALEQKLFPADGAAGDGFGTHVSTDGATLVASSPADDDVFADAGSVYVFVRSGATWTPQQKLLPTGATIYTDFGACVGLSANTIAVAEFACGSGNGHAYVFTRSGSVWSLEQKIAGPNCWGGCVAVDGNTLAVRTDAEGVDVFTRSGTVWSFQQTLPKPPGADGFAQEAIALQGDTLVVPARLEDVPASNAGAAYVYTRSGTVWSLQQRVQPAGVATGDLFGSSVSLDASSLVLGSYGDSTAASDAGSAYVFTRTGTVWSEQKKLLALDASVSDTFGAAVGISGTTVLVGAPYHDQPDQDSGALYAYLYTDPLPNGSACIEPGACASGFCIDGYCCNSLCAASCQACSAAIKGSGSNGTCGPIAAGTDPQNDCTAQPSSTCGNTGECSGASACRKHPPGTQCASATCAGPDAQANPDTCDGAGTCVDNGTTPCPNGYACIGIACRTTCSSDGDCASAFYCRAATGQCVADDPVGSPCNSPGHCASGFCVDGVCCSTACTAPCMSCSAGLTGGTSGTCSAVLANTDPLGDCPQDATSTCQRDGLCDGTGQCRPFYPAGTICGATTCSADVLSGATCNGTGSCTLGSTPCLPYRCASGTACATSCSSDIQCQPSAWCRVTDNTCQPDLAAGAPCTTAAQCSSGFCVDGRCCDALCNGPCQACSAAKKGGGADGACGPIVAGSDPDNECTDQGATSCGTNGVCSGAGACALFPPGTACGVTSCSAGTQTGNACDGFGSCQAAQTTPCTPYRCAGSACGTLCVSDLDCVAAAYCSGASRCELDQANGAPCASASQCTSGACVDGVCCDQACTGICRACSASAKGFGTDGVCEAVGAGSDPDDDCAVDPASSCDKDGQCDGAGACRRYGLGTVCGAATCTGWTLTGSQCNGLGACVPGSVSLCEPYLCSSSTACGLSCGTNADCIPTAYCAGGLCTAKLAQGGSCTSSGQCASAFCVDGVCCDTACNGVCQACAAASKQSGTDDGTCGAAAVGLDPHDDCTDDGATSCDRDGNCDGAGQCALYAAGVQCGVGRCDGTKQSGWTAVTSVCDGGGACLADTTTACALNGCSNGSCLATCADDGDCARGAVCNSGACEAPKALGDACAEDRECESGLCVDGYCCDGPCGGQCEACDVSGALGRCVPVLGSPHGSTRSACGAGSPEDPCTATECDGSLRGACAGFAGPAVTCRAASCADGVATLSAACSGSSSCPVATTVPCEPYGCSGDACAAACGDDTDCHSDYRCEPPRCVARGAECADEFTLRERSGMLVDCSPYKCEGGGCRDSCVRSSDCSDGFACDSAKCVEAVAAAPSSADEGGCGCRAAGRAPSQAVLPLGVALLVAMRRRRRGTDRASSGARRACRHRSPPSRCDDAARDASRARAAC